MLPVVPSTDGRPLPPAFLSPDEAAQWRIYVEALPADWFPPEVQPLLSELCETITLSHRLAGELRAVKSLKGDESFQKFMELVRAKIQVSALIMQLSTKLRCTVQSRLTARKASSFAETARFPKPWDLTGDSADDRADEPAVPDWGPRPTPRKN